MVRPVASLPCTLVENRLGPQPNSPAKPAITADAPWCMVASYSLHTLPRMERKANRFTNNGPSLVRFQAGTQAAVDGEYAFKLLDLKAIEGNYLRSPRRRTAMLTLLPCKRPCVRCQLLAYIVKVRTSCELMYLVTFAPCGCSFIYNI